MLTILRYFGNLYFSENRETFHAFDIDLVNNDEKVQVSMGNMERISYF